MAVKFIRSDSVKTTKSELETIEFRKCLLEQMECVQRLLTTVCAQLEYMTDEQCEDLENNVDNN